VLTLGTVRRGASIAWTSRTGPSGGPPWTFRAPRQASYRFHFMPDFLGGFDVLALPGPRLLAQTHGRGGVDDWVSLPLDVGTYAIRLDQNLAEGGAYRLWVEEDVSPGAAIRPEDPEVVGPLCVTMPEARGADLRGTFESRPGGVRASCGGTGTAVVYDVEVGRSSVVRVHALGEFGVVLELRADCQHGPVVSCVSASGYEADL
jgi:hypothetical protein